MNRANNISEVPHVVLDASQLLGISEEALHLLLSAPIPKLQVIQHRVVLLREPLIRVLNIRHVGTKLVGIIRHVNKCSVR